MNIRRRAIIRYIFTGRLNKVAKAWRMNKKRTSQVIQSGPQIRGSKVYIDTFKIVADER